MENSLEELNQALCDVRKAHRLIYAYQQKMLDLTHFIKTKLGFPEYAGIKRFSNKLGGTRSDYAELKLHNGMWAWDFLYSYVFEYYLGEKDGFMCMSIIQVSDTGYFDSIDLQKTKIDTFKSEEESESKLIFVIEKKIKSESKFAWNPDWIQKELFNNQDRMSKNHTKDCLRDEDNVQIIFSFPLERFSNEKTTLEALNEFISYCDENDISLKLV